MWRSASPATRRSAAAKARRSRKALNPCFVLASTGTRATRPAVSPRKSAWTRCVWTICGADRRIRRDEPADEDRRGRRVKAQLLDVHPALAEPRRELRRPGLVLVEHREADVVPALAQRREEEQEVVLGAGDPGDLGDVEDARAHRASSTTRSAHTSTECSRTTVSRSARPTAFRSRRCEPADRVGQPVDVAVLEPELRWEQRVERGVGRDDGQAGRRRLVDDLVGRARGACR